MIKKILFLCLSLSLMSFAEAGDQGVVELTSLYNSGSYLVAKGKKRRSSKKRRRSSRRKVKSTDLTKALRLVKSEKYEEASKILFKLSFSPKFRKKRPQIKYILGLVLHQLKFYQGAAFQFISVIKKGNNKYISQSLEKLSLAADKLEDDTLLNYAITKVKLHMFPRMYRDLLNYRIGEFQLRNKNYSDAARSLGRLKRSSNLYGKAKYLQGVAYAELKNNRRALRAFEDLVLFREEAPITDSLKVAGLIGKARVHYQNKNWSAAIDAYREIPRDTVEWHDTLFESSWAMLRSGRFRSALSNFQSLHSTFYEDYYLPESLLVRSIVYLYICKYDEMDKILTIFNRLYKPVYKDVKSYLTRTKNPTDLFNETVRVILDFKRGVEPDRSKYKVPYIVLRHLVRNGDFQRGYRYIKNLLEERRRWESMPSSWKQSSVGKYVKRVQKRRLLKARAKSGRVLRAELQGVKDDLFDLFEQEAFIRYEMLSGKKEFLKKRVAGKELPDATIDQANSRDYYIQNGYEYWTFKGENWLDELGNYHYVGTQSCE